MRALKIITTADGSHSLLNEQLNETYHSHHGAVQESVHVFIKHGLLHKIVQSSDKTINILEIGFGTGLNALLTIRALKDFPEHTFRYMTLESSPLEKDVWSKLNYAADESESAIFKSIHETDWNNWCTLLSSFYLRKEKCLLQEIALDDHAFDVVYFDAFAPGKQPEMWTLDVLSKVVTAMKPDGVFVTYCAKGQLKRDLKQLGLMIDVLAGPPGKKEMTRGTKSNAAES